MRFFGLHPDDLSTRFDEVPEAVLHRAATQSVLRGIVGFGIPSLLVFGSWALQGRWLYGNLTELGAYGVWAVLFILTAGVGLRGLLLVPCSIGRFLALFGTAFFAYSVGWTVAWFALRNKLGEVAGAVVGTALFAAIICAALGAGRQFWRCWFALLLPNAAGYFLGGVCYEQFGGTTGKLLWGACYGVGFGAGLGLAFHVAQEPLKRLIVLSRPEP
jgi:hypothetical protein